jgi:hypothetical protein
MKTSLRAVFSLGVVLSALFLSRFDASVSAQTVQRPAQELLSAKEGEFLQFGQDFFDFAKSTRSTSPLESGAAEDLGTLSSETADQLHAAQILLQISGDLTSPEDRARVFPLVETELLRYSREIGLSVEEVNLDIGYLEGSGVSAEASRMRDSLRQVRDALGTIQVQ